MGNPWPGPSSALLKPGEHMVELVDADGNTLASTKLMIPKPAKKK